MITQRRPGSSLSRISNASVLKEAAREAWLFGGRATGEASTNCPQSAASLPSTAVVERAGCQPPIAGDFHGSYQRQPSATPNRPTTARCSLSRRRTLIYYDFGDFRVASASPGSWCGRSTPPPSAKVTIRPLAGTRPPAAPRSRLDKATEAGAGGRPKERAEHVMLIDLARNDIGRIAKTGSVKVTGFRGGALQPRDAIHRQQRRGHPDEGMTNMDVAEGHLPAGTLSGAPGYAMDFIDQLEPGQARHLRRRPGLHQLLRRRHGPGHRHPQHRHRHDQTLYRAGGGWQADSVPEMEWKRDRAQDAAAGETERERERERERGVGVMMPCQQPTAIRRGRRRRPAKNRE